MLIQALPVSFRGSADLLGLIHDKNGSRSETHEGMFKGFVQSPSELPPRRTVCFTLLLAQRKDVYILKFQDGSLRFRIKAPNGFDFIAEEFDAYGLGLLGRKDIQDSATYRIFTG